ncbi:hypothetical protein BKA70DRAFT_1275382 [Coprinopsis sp. MPI-PUGE-AT-0042]|nr:hypothetical protein BKA70DRAFT_1275382 [Coprinopsis sp. MPI-PUGE-AT-0042]
MGLRWVACVAHKFVICLESGPTHHDLDVLYDPDLGVFFCGTERSWKEAEHLDYSTPVICLQIEPQISVENKRCPLVTSVLTFPLFNELDRFRFLASFNPSCSPERAWRDRVPIFFTAKGVGSMTIPSACRPSIRDLFTWPVKIARRLVRIIFQGLIQFSLARSDPWDLRWDAKDESRLGVFESSLTGSGNLDNDPNDGARITSPSSDQPGPNTTQVMEATAFRKMWKGRTRPQVQTILGITKSQLGPWTSWEIGKLFMEKSCQRRQAQHGPCGEQFAHFEAPRH